METVSVVVPIYKVEQYLCQCMDSIVNQTYRNLEIILIDDGSPDNCGTICDEYAAKDMRIKVIHKKNGGLASARNTGIEYATGEWVAFVDSDDWCERDYYEQLISHASGTRVDIFWAGGYYRESPSGTVVQTTIDEPFLASEMGMDERTRYLEKVLSFGPPWDKLFRRSFLDEYHVHFDVEDKANEDVWFNFIAHCVADSVGGYSCIGYHWRTVPVSITRGYQPRKAEYCYRLIQKCHNYVRELEMNDRLNKAIERRSLEQIRTSLRCSWFHPGCPLKKTEKRKEIREMKSWPYYAEAIWSQDKMGLSRKRRFFRRLLRMRSIWPLEMVYLVNEMRHKVGEHLQVVKNKLNLHRGGVISSETIMGIPFPDNCRIVHSQTAMA